MATTTTTQQPATAPDSPRSAPTSPTLRGCHTTAATADEHGHVCLDDSPCEEPATIPQSGELAALARKFDTPGPAGTYAANAESQSSSGRPGGALLPRPALSLTRSDARIPASITLLASGTLPAVTDEEVAHAITPVTHVRMRKSRTSEDEAATTTTGAAVRVKGLAKSIEPTEEELNKAFTPLHVSGTRSRSPGSMREIRQRAAAARNGRQ